MFLYVGCFVFCLASLPSGSCRGHGLAWCAAEGKWKKNWEFKNQNGGYDVGFGPRERTLSSNNSEFLGAGGADTLAWYIGRRGFKTSDTKDFVRFVGLFLSIKER